MQKSPELQPPEASLEFRQGIVFDDFFGIIALTLEFENFNAGSALFTIQGRNVHPGYAKGKMLNALRVATAIVDTIPAAESPEQTEGYEGFYHLMSINGGVDQAEVSYIIRDHDKQIFEKRLAYIGGYRLNIHS